MNRYEIKNTPFYVIEDEKTGVCKIILGNHLASNKEFDTVKEAQEYVNEKPWELIINLCGIMYENISIIEKESEVKDA